MCPATDLQSRLPQGTDSPRALARWLLAAGLILGALATPVPADRIVLRNLEIIADDGVASFDEDGIRLESGRTVTWDQVDKGTVVEADRERFDRMLQALGDHLYRIRLRLQTGNYKDLAVHTEAVYPRYAGRLSPTAYMVFQATMWSRLASGRREGAVEPYLRCLGYLRRLGQSQVSLPGTRRLEFDPSTGITPELLPVWFDPAAAKAAMPGVLDAIKQMGTPLPPAAHVYYGTLALAAGEKTRALEVLAGIANQEGTGAELYDVAMAQAELTSGEIGKALGKLERTVEDLSPASRPLALYWLGMAKIQSDDARTRQQGVLYLLHLPAVYGTRHPHLAGAGIYRAMETLVRLGDQAGTDALREELLLNYGQTFHAMKVRTEQHSDSRK